jgi:hypothetical protein
MLATHRIGVPHHLAIVAPKRLPGPKNPSRFWRNIDVQQLRRRVTNHQAKDFLHMWLQCFEVGLFIIGGRAQGNTSHTQKNPLLGRRQSSGVPGSAAQIGADIDARQYQVGASPKMETERDAIRRGAVDPVSFEILHWSPFVSKWSVRSDGMPHRRLLNVGCDNTHSSESTGHCCQSGNPGTVDPVIIGDQNTHIQCSTGSRQAGAGFVVDVVHTATPASSIGQEHPELVSSANY